MRTEKINYRKLFEVKVARVMRKKGVRFFGEFEIIDIKFGSEPYCCVM
jgi:hypothetical protein